jgi:hypothetical protein
MAEVVVPGCILSLVWRKVLAVVKARAVMRARAAELALYLL